MSSSSLSSSLELTLDGGEDVLSEELLADVERFADLIGRLRSSLDPHTTIPDGESMCVAVHAALSMVSQTVRDLLIRHPNVFKTSIVLLPISQLVHSVKTIAFDVCPLEACEALKSISRLESAIGSALRYQLNSPPPPLPISTSISFSPSKSTIAFDRLGARRLIHSTSTTKPAPAMMMTPTSSDSLFTVYGNRSVLPKNRAVSATLIRRHSTFQSRHGGIIDANCDEMDRMLVFRDDGLVLAFERSKAWSKYCKDLLQYVQGRLALDLEHQKRVQKLAEQTKLAINQTFLPLKDIFVKCCDNELFFGEETNEMCRRLNERFVKALDARKQDHDTRRKALKNEWNKCCKNVQDTATELKKARQNETAREDSYKKARESSLKRELSGSGSADMTRRRREIERRRRMEEEALVKKEEAGNMVRRLEHELSIRRETADNVKVRIVAQLRELVYQCDQTTKACSYHYFQNLAQLWLPQPSKLQELADQTRSYTPGTEYMSFLQSLPGRINSSSQLPREEEDIGSVGHSGTHRRNAIDDHNGTLLQKREKTIEVELSDAARTHRLQRIRAPAKCDHCETLSLLQTMACAECGLHWHKACLSKVTLSCGPSARVQTNNARRVSIFGVSLQIHLDIQNSQIPPLLERCIDQLQTSGMRVKGLYRICGVKSKIEELCESFERVSRIADIDLHSVHPMNLASIVKLYLRKLPEPLLSHQLYSQWIAFAQKCIKSSSSSSSSSSATESSVLVELRHLVEQLPEENYKTLRFLLLHLNRVTWFESDNLMSACNLGAVISPSMIWAAEDSPSFSFITDAHLQSKVVELLVTNAFEIFAVDRAADWRLFFEQYTQVDEPALEMGDTGDVLDEEDVESPFLAQPPTPDLLKNTARGKASTADSESTTPRTYSIDSTTSSSRGACRRSYTTSILVDGDRRPPLKHQHSIDSSEVTLQLGREQSFSESSGSLVGLVFTGSDVSYV